MSGRRLADSNASLALSTHNRRLTGCGRTDAAAIRTVQRAFGPASRVACYNANRWPDDGPGKVPCQAIQRQPTATAPRPRLPPTPRATCKRSATGRTRSCSRSRATTARSCAIPLGRWPSIWSPGRTASSTSLQDNHKNYSKDTFQYNLLSTITGNGLLTSDGDFWLRQRRLAAAGLPQDSASPVSRADDRRGCREDAGALGGRARGRRADRCGRRDDARCAADRRQGACSASEIGDQADELATATLTVLDHIVGRARTFGMVPRVAADAGQPRLTNGRCRCSTGGLRDDRRSGGRRRTGE